MRRNVCFRYYEGITGALRAASPPLLVYTDAQLVIDSISRFQNFVFQADRSREIQIVVKEHSWKRCRVVGEVSIPIADLIYQQNQEFAFILRPSTHNIGRFQHFDCQIHVVCHFVPEYRQSIEETINNLSLNSQNNNNLLVDEDNNNQIMKKSIMTESTSNSSVLSSSISRSDGASSSLSSGSSNLPPGWEARVDQKGRILYLDHINKTTTWKPPTILEPESDDQSDVAMNSNIRYPYSRRTVVTSSNYPEKSFHTRPISFLLQHNFVDLLHNNPDALKLYNESLYLKHIIHKIRKEPKIFEKFEHNRELVDFLNFFADKTQPLPTGWQIARKPNFEQRLFIDHHSRQITLIDPRLPAEARRRAKSAPPVRRNHDHNGNPIVEILQRTDEIARLVKLRFPEIAPRVCQKLQIIKHNGAEALLRYANDIDLITAISALEARQPVPKTEFEEKLAYFHQSLQRAGYGQGPGKIRFRLRRSHLLNDAFEKVLAIDATQLKKYHMTVTFDEEDGLDYGGPSRELFFLLSRELFNPYYGLFECSSNDNYTVQVSTMSKFVENHLQWMELCGRVLGLALIHRCMIDTFFTRAFYKMLIGL
uniref:HECT-type E3 ubiquitin transferase n=1 Tax=Panagrolaimus superbus TaxID=310955 RepID=A0A914XU54_9BILA